MVIQISATYIVRGAWYVSHLLAPCSYIPHYVIAQEFLGLGCAMALDFTSYTQTTAFLLVYPSPKSSR